MQIKDFSDKHPIIFNAILIIIAFFAISFLSFFAMDVFTQHGKEQEVPNIKGLPLREAIATLESENLKWQISDSVYNDKFKPGSVIDQNPKANSFVKSKRTIYLTVNPFCPRSALLPRIKEMSIRQGQSILEGLGFHNIDIQTVPSEYNGLILGISINGHQIEPGTKVMLSSRITLSVGDGNAQQDSIDNSDSDIIENGGPTITDPSLI